MLQAKPPSGGFAFFRFCTQTSSHLGQNCAAGSEGNGNTCGAVLGKHGKILLRNQIGKKVFTLRL
jgi:hypothetical protein